MIHEPVTDDVITEPRGRAGIRFVGIRNPSPFLERTVINRNEAYLLLQGHNLNLTLKAGKDPYLELDPELRFDYMTEAVMDPRTGMPKVVKKKGGAVKIHHAHYDEFVLTRPSFFTKTSKMSAASWSIPAGPPSVGGACAAAELYKNQNQYQVAIRQGEVEQRPAVKQEWICSYCYAGKSNYMHRTAQYSQTARLIWLTGMVKAHGVDGAAEQMAAALKHHLGNAKERVKAAENPKFFRIHDSGDFQLSPNTYLVWVRIAEQLPDVSFWAPSRQWVFPKFNELVRSHQPPDNMSLRPSALHFGDIAPELDGWDSGSTAHDISVDPVKTEMADWICPAYKHDGHSCAGAGGPKGETDCRVCWKYTDMAVSYRSH